MPVRWKLAIFDFDGTLCDSFAWFLDVGDQLADRYGFRRLDRSNLPALRALGARELLRRHEVPLWQLPFIVREARRLLGGDAARTPLFPGIGAALNALADRGVVLAIVSSNARDNIVGVLGPELAARISRYGCGASLFGKPAKLRRVVRESGLPADAALLIGDELRDAAAAREAGIAYGAVGWGYTDLEALLGTQPEAVFRSVAELAQLA